MGKAGVVITSIPKHMFYYIDRWTVILLEHIISNVSSYHVNNAALCLWLLACMKNFDGICWFSAQPRRFYSNPHFS